MVSIEFIEEVREHADEIFKHFFDLNAKHENLTPGEREALIYLVDTCKRIMEYDDLTKQLKPDRERYLELKRRETY